MASKAKPGTAVAKSEPKNTALAEVDMDELAADGAAQQFDRNDLTIPFLKVLQDMTPQAQKASPDFVKGASSGMFLNSATNRLWDGEDKGVLLIPVLYTRSYTEWTPISEGGGFIRDHGANGAILKECARGEKGGYFTKEGKEIVEAAMYFVMIVDPETGECENAAFVLKGTQWKKARKWNDMLAAKQEVQGKMMVVAPYFNVYRVKTTPEHNDQGNWYGVTIEKECNVFELPNGAQLYRDARAMAALVGKGEVKVNMNDLGGEDPTAHSDEV